MLHRRGQQYCTAAQWGAASSKRRLASRAGPRTRPVNFKRNRGEKLHLDSSISMVSNGAQLWHTAPCARAQPHAQHPAPKLQVTCGRPQCPPTCFPSSTGFQCQHSAMPNASAAAISERHTSSLQACTAQGTVRGRRRGGAPLWRRHRCPACLMQRPRGGRPRRSAPKAALQAVSPRLSSCMLLCRHP